MATPEGRMDAVPQWDPDVAGVVVFPGGHRVRGRGLRAGPPPEPADFGVYLTGTEHLENAWESRWVRWPDFWLPHSTSEAVSAVREAFARAGSERVEIACKGGTGRTGTALALMACMSGVPPREAVTWVRQHYRPRAVETPWQRRWIIKTAPTAVNHDHYGG
ncbi:protein-tyrosine phosphatase family protein [Mycolicibacterium mageritense]|uniref:Protein-tyrosine-phosphatase n=1 Tax=Mycolicibacterium mageritense TaxID=53462 RepID=A0ABM7HQK9_MYCME|nr:protein-tyrosine phosphatase family protein [Mycolicibacterium mageritense]BBX32809.1 protein-tyrosine-phosphatase [Mycolicibacterium mageritense]